ncbi:MAG: hypothetical protein ACYTGX_02815 [Planctomycetota bacterium]|jgi:hypothetical protein
MRVWLTASLLCLGLALAVPAQETAPAAPDFGRLIERLGDEKYDVREAAEAALLRAGDPAIPAVEAALAHADAEVRHRARRLARKLGVILPEALDALYRDVFTLLLEVTDDRRRTLLAVRTRIRRFAEEYPLAYPGPPRVVRSEDGKLVIAIGRSPSPKADPVAEAAAKETPPLVRIEDDDAVLVIAVGVNGQAGRPRGQAGGGAKAFAPNGLAIALGGSGGAAHAERFAGGFRIVSRGMGGKAGASSKVPGIGFEGRQAGMFKPGGGSLGNPSPPRVPVVRDAEWAEIRRFAADALRD